MIWLLEYFCKQTMLPPIQKIFDHLFQCWFSYQSNKLKQSGALENDIDVLIEHCWVYTRAVALKLKEVGTYNIDLNDVFADESEIIQWSRFFSDEKYTRLVALSCLWQVNDKYQLSLCHPTIIAYFANLTNYDLNNYLELPFIHVDEGIEQLSQLLDREVLQANNSQMLHSNRPTFHQIFEQ